MNTPWKWTVGLAGGIVAIGGAWQVGERVYDRMPVPESTKEFHDTAPLSKSTQQAIDKIMGVVAIPTIIPLARRACLEPNEPRWRAQLSERLDWYRKGEGYEFIVPSCDELLQPDTSQ